MSIYFIWYANYYSTINILDQLSEKSSNIVRKNFKNQNCSNITNMLIMLVLIINYHSTVNNAGVGSKTVIVENSV